MPVNTARFLIDVKKHWGALEEESFTVRGAGTRRSSRPQKSHTPWMLRLIHDYSGSVKSWPEHTNA